MRTQCLLLPSFLRSGSRPTTGRRSDHPGLRTLAGSVLVACAASADAQSSSRDPLEGIWGVVHAIPQAGGALRLDSAAGVWSLSFRGHTLSVRPLGDTMRFVVADAGTLRVRLRHGAVPHAMWIQPPGLGPAYASPVRLERAGRAQLRGVIRPVTQRFSLYLLIDRDATGVLRGRFRNPEANFGGGRMFHLTRRGDTIELRDPESGLVRFTQPYDSARRTITFDFGLPLVARPLAPSAAVGAVARHDTGTVARYRVPIAAADGWRPQSAATAGVSSDTLTALIRRLVAADPYDRERPEIHAVLLARRGRLLFEEYFHGFNIDQLHDLRSASKTVTSILVGAAIAHGVRLSASTPVTPAGTTIGQLLTHRSGLDCNDEDPRSPGHEDRMQGQQADPDWYRFAQALPQLAPPGTRYAYCSAAYNLVGRAIREATGSWLPELFDRTVAQPLGIRHYGINLMPTGEGYAAGGMQLRARDLLRLGQLSLDGGEWHGQRLIDREWMAASTARQQPLPEGPDDGYGWHRHLLSVGGRSIASYEASGNGGQFLVVVPSHDLVAVVLAGNYGEGRLWWRIRQEIIARYLVSAVQDVAAGSSMPPPRAARATPARRSARAVWPRRTGTAHAASVRLEHVPR